MPPSPAPIAELELLPGAVVASSYRIVRTLGRGGMATVYLVKHVHMHKTFALKLLHAEAMESTDIVARFEREAVASANIEHPNVAQVFASTCDNRTCEVSSPLGTW